MALSKKQKIAGIIVALILIGLGILTALGEFPPEDLSGKFRNKNRINTAPVAPTSPTYNLNQPSQPSQPLQPGQSAPNQPNVAPFDLIEGGNGSQIDWPGNNIDWPGNN